MDMMFEKVETPQDTSIAVIANLVEAEPGTYRVAMGSRKELERLRMAVRDAGFKVTCRQLEFVDGVYTYTVEVVVTGEAGEAEPVLEVSIPPQPRKVRARGVAKMEAVEELTPLETGI